MHDLLLSSQTASPALSPPPPTSPVILQVLNPLHNPKDGAFLKRPDFLAGRHVCIVLYATSDRRDERERAWKEMVHEGANLADLGRAAKVIENAGFNWRELSNHEDVLAAAESLKAPGATL